jgi:hypothetical protein
MAIRITCAPSSVLLRCHSPDWCASFRACWCELLHGTQDLRRRVRPKTGLTPYTTKKDPRSQHQLVQHERRRHDGNHWKAQRSEEDTRANSDNSKPCQASEDKRQNVKDQTARSKGAWIQHQALGIQHINRGTSHAWECCKRICAGVDGQLAPRVSVTMRSPNGEICDGSDEDEENAKREARRSAEAPTPTPISYLIPHTS